MRVAEAEDDSIQMKVRTVRQDKLPTITVEMVDALRWQKADKGNKQIKEQFENSNRVLNGFLGHIDKFRLDRKYECKDSSKYNKKLSKLSKFMNESPHSS
jgi:hypothetical protein